MNKKFLAGIALAALPGAVAMTGTVNAADLGGSVKDGGYVAPLPEVYRGGAGPCYFRGDVGYGFSSDPTIKFPVFNDVITGFFTQNDQVNGRFVQTDQQATFITDRVNNTTRDDGVIGSVAAGCGWGGSRGIRAEIEFGFYGSRDVYGEPGIFSRTINVIEDPNIAAPPVPPAPLPPDPEIDDPLHTRVTSYSSFVNFYKDLGKWGNITPYVGGGVGVAYHEVDQTFFTNNIFLQNRIDGQNNLAFAWQAGAGIGYQISDRAIIDVGYRYVDLGKAESGRADDAGFVNPRVKLDNIAEHEIKVGLRYSFGGGDEPSAPSYAPIK